MTQKGIELGQMINDVLKSPLKSSSFRRALKFLADNDFFGAAREQREGQIFISPESVDDLKDRLQRFFEHYEEPESKRLLYIKAHLTERFPETMARLGKLLSMADESMKHPPYQFYDFLAAYLSKDIHLMDNQELRKLALEMDSAVTKKAMTYFAFFTDWMRMAYPVQYTFQVEVKKRKEQSATEAYDMATIVLLYYYFFSDEYLTEEHVLQKACDNAKYANTLAYFCIHLISALRDPDIEALPRPDVEDPKKLLASIRDGSFSDEEAARALRSIMNSMNCLLPVPKKTSDTAWIPSLYLFVPQSLEAHFGRLFLICEAHRRLSGDDSPFLANKAADYWELLDLMGQDVAEPFRERDFSPISFSKSFMQGLALLASQGGEGGALERAMLGYLLAQRARSHSGGLNLHSETTAIYLKDNAFTGLNASVIVCELFERGILSNIPGMLLSMISQGTYDDLTFPQQTRLIQELGLSPLEVEKLMNAFLLARQNSQDTIKSVLGLPGPERKEAVHEILHKLAIGMAPAKTDGALCFMMALDRPCPYPCLKQCLACRFRIDTRGTLYQVGGEYKRLVRLLSEARTDGERLKYQHIIFDYLIPAINDALSAAGEELGKEMAGFFGMVLAEASELPEADSSEPATC